MKKAIIVHCWEGYPEYCWYPYAKHQLERRGFKVEVPFFIDPLPLLSKWLDKIRKTIGEPDENTFLIGHSLGSVAVLKYLQSLQKNERIGGVVLVAGFTNDLGFRPLYNFFNNPLDFEKIRQHCDKFVLIASDNDPYVDDYHTDVLQHRLKADVMIRHCGHFTEDKNKSQYLELPELVLAIESMDLKSRPARKSEERIKISPFRRKTLFYEPQILH